MDSVGSPWISMNENASGSKIGMSCYNKEAEIYYTTDKSNPVTSGTRMLYQSDFLWNSSEYPVIKAAAMEDGKHNSAVVTKCLHNYNASILADAACEKPEQESIPVRSAEIVIWKKSQPQDIQLR